jgi:hypothetical protein
MIISFVWLSAQRAGTTEETASANNVHLIASIVQVLLQLVQSVIRIAPYPSCTRKSARESVLSIISTLQTSALSASPRAWNARVNYQDAPNATVQLTLRNWQITTLLTQRQ